jgi:molecular chaperone DnaJ
MVFSKACLTCGGTGQQRPRACDACAGSGQETRSETATVRIPPGIANGERVRIPGKGNAGMHGGPPGDLLITFEVQPDPEWKREGLDLIRTVPVNVAQATLGSRITVRSLHDKQVALRIPAGTDSGKRFRVRGQGIEKGGQRGDMIVEVAISVPDKLNEKAQQAMKEFAAAGGLEY